MGGGGSNLGVRMIGQLSGPVTDIVLEPRCRQKAHRVFLAKESLGSVDITFYF